MASLWIMFPFLLIKQCFSKIEEVVCMLCDDYSFHRNLFLKALSYFKYTHMALGSIALKHSFIVMM